MFIGNKLTGLTVLCLMVNPALTIDNEAGSTDGPRVSLAMDRRTVPSTRPKSFGYKSSLSTQLATGVCAIRTLGSTTALDARGETARAATPSQHSAQINKLNRSLFLPYDPAMRL